MKSLSSKIYRSINSASTKTMGMTLGARNFSSAKPLSKDKGKLVLLYSGGLDTSCILRWLLEEGYDVLPMICNIGQYGEDFEAARKKAIGIGASKVYVEDVREEFIKDFVFPAIQFNGIYEDRYQMGTSLARYPIAKRAIEIAKKEGAVAVGHGATGKGNDQVRFELSFLALAPHLKCIVPWRDPTFFNRFAGRQDLIEFAKASGIPVTQTKKKPYSTDENIFHISYESGVLEDPWNSPPADMFVMTKSPKDARPEPEQIIVSFEKGIPIKVEHEAEKKTVTGPLPILEYLNELGRRNGIGRVDIVENRFVGMKSRGVYETPGGAILRAAHLDIEGITLDREVRRIRDVLSLKFSELAYNGFWFSPEMEFLLSTLTKAQENVTGDVKLELYRGNITYMGRRAPYSLYDKSLVSMDEGGGWNPRDSEGFIRINSVRMRSYQKLKERMLNDKKNKKN